MSPALFSIQLPVNETPSDDQRRIGALFFCLQSGSSDGVNQDDYSTKGNTWILTNYPQINFIEKALITYQCPVSSSID